jgi:FkbM family methyltransferase
MIDYSQSHEQRVILKYFAGQTGTFLDIGANDGLTYSNSRALALLGWRGVLVEPAESAFRKLGAHYKEIRPADDGDLSKGMVCAVASGINLVNAAITTEDGPIDFWDSGTHLRKGDTSLLSTTIPSEMARWKTSGEKFTKTQVRGITFATLMKETGVTRFDFISIDCEGADYDVLRQIDLHAVGCRCLCVEYNGADEKKFSDYTAKFGMRLRWKSRINLIFCA